LKKFLRKVKRKKKLQRRRSSKDIKVTIVLFTVSFLVVICGIFFLFADNIGQRIIKKDAQSYIEISPDEMKKNKESQKVKEEASYDSAQVTSLNTEDIIVAQFSKDNLAAVGVLSIPNLQINLPIFLGVGYNTMMYGSGMMRSNQTMGKGNYSLASHTIFDMQGRAISDVLFGNLKNAQKGQEVYITDKEKVYLYIIDKIEQHSEEESEVILDHSNKKELTLVTCLGYKVPGRLVIHGNLKSVKDYNNQTDKVFKQPFNQWYK
jgi:sortase A